MIEFPIANAQERAAAAKKAGKTPDTDAELVAAAREALFRQFDRMGYAKSAGGLKAAIKGECVISPTDWEKRYNLTHGAVFGLSHGLLQLACFRPPRQTGISALDAAKVQGLHFVGASTRPGNGVPLVLMGVANTFENIIREQSVDSGPPPLALKPMDVGSTAANDSPAAHAAGTAAAEEAAKVPVSA